MGQQQALTKPQANLLLKSVRAAGMVYVSRQRVRTASTLCRLGYFYKAESSEGYSHTRAGLEALADYWMRKDAASGCMAYRLTREEVEAALAEQVSA